MPLRFEQDAFEGVPQADTQRLLTKIEWLWNNRRAVTHHPLAHELSGMFKRRVGKYRILYTYDANPDEMVIRIVGTRDSIYSKATSPPPSEAPEEAD